MATLEQLTQEIAETTALFNKLRDEKTDPALLDETKKRLGELKKSQAVLKNAASGGKEVKKKERLLLKTAKVLCHKLA